MIDGFAFGALFGFGAGYFLWGFFEKNKVMIFSGLLLSFLSFTVLFVGAK